MLAKSVCVVINALAFMRGVQPPPAAAEDMTDAEKKKNRDQFKGSEAEVVEAAFTNILLGYVVIALLALSYLWWMYRGAISPDLTLWHTSLSIIGTLGCLLRIWSFNELGRFFTVKSNVNAQVSAVKYQNTSLSLLTNLIFIC